MKKVLISLLACAAIVGCTKSGDVDSSSNGVINFGQTVVASRAPVNTIGDNDKFKVYGVEHTDAFASAAWAATNLIDALDVNGLGVYGGDRVYYSNAAGQKHSFFAYYPSDLTVATAAGDGVAPVVSFDCATQPDLLWASVKDVVKSAVKVKFDFAHQLAQIQLVVKAEAGYTPNPEAVVTAASLLAKSTGTMDVETGVVTLSGDAAADFAVTGTVNTVVGAADANVGDVVMLPVQTIASVKVTISGREVTVPVSGLGLLAGKLTKIVLTVNGSSISFDAVTVVAWVPGGTDGAGDVVFN